MIKRYRIKEKRLLHVRVRMNRFFIQEPYKPCWVKPSVIRDKTGWNHEKLRQARENGYVQFKEDQNGFWYDLASIHEKLLINPESRR